MVRNIKGGDCDGAVRPTECDVSLGAQFTLSVDALGIPDNGYIVAVTFIHFGAHLTYLPTLTPEEEIIWPDCVDGLAVRLQLPYPPLLADELVSHTCLTDTAITSTYVGNFVEIALQCGPADSSTLVRLIPNTDPLLEGQGTLFRDGAGAFVTPKTGNLVVNCGAGGPLTTPTPKPTVTPTATPVPQPTPTFPAPKPNDDFAGAFEIVGTPFKNKEDTSGMTIELGEATSCHGMTNSVWYSFTPPTDRLLEANTAGSSFSSPMMAVYTGSTLVTLTEVGCAARQVFIAEAGVTYYFQLGGCTISLGNLRCLEDGGSLQFSLESGPVPEMVLNAPNGDCDHPVRPTKCDLPVGQKFSLNVDILSAPFLGYTHAQAYLEFGEYLPENTEDPDAVDDPETPFIEGPGPCDDGIDNGRDDGHFHSGDRFDSDCVDTGVVHKPTAATVDEFLWPDCSLAIRAVAGTGTTLLGCLTGVTAPLDVSFYEGPFIALSMTCSEDPSTTEVRLLPSNHPMAGTSGALFTSPQVDQIIPYVSGLTVNCVAPAAVGGVVVSDDLRPLEQTGADHGPAGNLIGRLTILIFGIALGTVGWFLRRWLRV